MRLTFTQIALLNLKQVFSEEHHLYCTREKAYENLKYRTGQDFGFDVGAWEEWLKESDKRFSRRGKQKS